MVDQPGAHHVDPADETRHPAGDEELWQESYYADFVAEDGSVAGYARLGLYPNLNAAWWTTLIVGPDRQTVASLSYDLVVPANDGLRCTSDALDVACVLGDPLKAFGIEERGTAALYDDPAAIYAGDPGKPIELGVDLVWQTDGQPYHYELTTRYEIPCLVSGTLQIGDETISVRGHGQRDHSWGVRDWWAFGWCWASARLDDGTRVHLADIRMPQLRVPFGYLQPGDGTTETITGLDVSEELGAHGFPTRARIEIEPAGLGIDVEPLEFGPILLTGPNGQTSRFPRAYARFRADDGRTGTGWIEWNQPQV
jgi:hypothetical protein